MLGGTLKQLKGPFSFGQNVLGQFNDKVKIGISLDQKDFLPYGKYDEGFSFNLILPNGSSTIIKIGRTCMYETDQPITISGLSFIKPNGYEYDYTPQSVIINYVVY